MQRTEPLRGLLAVGRALLLARDRALVARKAHLLPGQRPKRLHEFALGGGGERRHSQVDAQRGRDLQRLEGLGALDLKGDMPPRARPRTFLREADVAQRAVHRLAHAKPDPAELGQLEAGLARVGRLERELLGVGEADARLLAAGLEARRLDAATATGLAGLGRFEEALVGRFQAPEHLLLGMHGALGEPRGLRCVAPGREPAAHLRVPRELLATLVALALPLQRHVPHAPAHARKAPQRPLLSGLAAQLEAVGLHAGHATSIRRRP